MNPPPKSAITTQLRILTERAGATADRGGVVALANWSKFALDFRDLLNRYRGLVGSDLVHLYAMSYRDVARHIAETAGVEINHQAVHQWLERYGPRTYTALNLEGDGPVWVRTVQVGDVRTTRQALDELRQAGWRIVPASWQVDDHIDGRQLWDRLEPPFEPG